MTPHEQLLVAAKRALLHLNTPGYQQGMYDDIIVGRMLREAIERVEINQRVERPEEVMIRR